MGFWTIDLKARGCLLSNIEICELEGVATIEISNGFVVQNKHG